ncbi:MAG TPA: helicase-related protein [Candidatus Saccharimonadales bacterium]|jgi:late competence protein required for DNA uptake (superfamily II DNA/RNA helicase)
MSTALTLEAIEALPVHSRQAEIVAAVDRNQVTIITAETGAGKSTQVPQYLAEHGYTKVIVTQPRILAARNLSARVRQEYSLRQGRDCSLEVGYRTANERDDNPDTIILYCTDGLQLVRELTGSGITGRQVLVLDEIHEWNENMEVLVAWARKRCQEEPAFKVVLMSATIETGCLRAYFDAPEPIAVSGRSYGVIKRMGSDIVADIHEQIAGSGGNMLVFLPGKAEIEQVAEAIANKASARDIPVIPLHSQLEPEAQQLAFRNYPNGKVVLTTNIAQTSVTIDDIDIVIDSGLERRSEVRNGVEGLFIAEVSQADCLQRAGRAGRTKAGTYILSRLGTMPCSPLDARPEYGIPEILRKHIDRLVLRLANINIDVESLEFYHAPSRTSIKFAKRTLVELGALSRTGDVTNIGRQMERFPVESSYARMLVEAGQYSETVRAKLASIIAIQEVGGIVKGSARYTGWRRYTRQTQSDLLAQYEVLLAVPSIPELEFDELGIIGKNVTKAQEVNERLNHELGLGQVSLTALETDEVPLLSRCIVAGQLHQLWTVENDGVVLHISTHKERELSSGTVVKHAGLIAGTPFDLQVSTPRGLETLHLVNDVTAVDPEWLEDLSPDQFKVSGGQMYFDSRNGILATQKVVRFGKRTIEGASTPLLERTRENQKHFVRLFSAWLHEQVETERQRLQSMNSRRIPVVQLRQIEDQVRYLADGAVSLAELPKNRRIELSKLAKVETYLGPKFMSTISTAPRGRSQHHGRFERRPQRRDDRRQRFDRRRGY